MEIAHAVTPQQTADARTLFREYATWLGVDLSFQNFATELAELPGAYAPPRGRLLLATIDAEPAGCVALRPLNDTDCEMKRLFIRPAFRAHGLGRQLVRQIIEEARDLGYGTMQLDTLDHMLPAIRLYESHGFRRRPPYYETPLVNMVFFELNL